MAHCTLCGRDGGMIPVCAVYARSQYYWHPSLRPEPLRARCPPPMHAMHWKPALPCTMDGLHACPHHIPRISAHRTLCGRCRGTSPLSAMASMYGRPCERPFTVSMFIAVVITVAPTAAMRAAKLPVPPPTSRPTLSRRRTRGRQRRTLESSFDA